MANENNAPFVAVKRRLASYPLPRIRHSFPHLRQRGGHVVFDIPTLCWHSVAQPELLLEAPAGRIRSNFLCPRAREGVRLLVDLITPAV